MNLEAPYQYTVHNQDTLELFLRFDEGKDLVARLSPILTGSEVRLRLRPLQHENAEQIWMLYWKLRESECRALLAHPETDAWVATLALEKGVASELFSQWEVGKSGSLNEICRLQEPSNFSIRWSFT